MSATGTPTSSGCMIMMAMAEQATSTAWTPYGSHPGVHGKKKRYAWTWPAGRSTRTTLRYKRGNATAALIRNGRSNISLRVNGLPRHARSRGLGKVSPLLLKRLVERYKKKIPLPPLPPPPPTNKRTHTYARSTPSPGSAGGGIFGVSGGASSPVVSRRAASSCAAFAT